MSIELSGKQIEYNCRNLFHYSIFDAKENGDLVGYSSWNLVQRVFLWVKNFVHLNADYKRVNDVVLSTLEGMRKEIIEDSHLCYFRTLRTGFYISIPYLYQFGHTYDELAIRIIQDGYFITNEQITKKAIQVINQMNRFPFFNLSGLNEEDAEKVKDHFIDLLTRASFHDDDIDDEYAFSMHHKRDWLNFSIQAGKTYAAKLLKERRLQTETH
jgi:hypothetical protein